MGPHSIRVCLEGAQGPDVERRQQMQAGLHYKEESRAVVLKVGSVDEQGDLNDDDNDVDRLHQEPYFHRK